MKTIPETLLIIGGVAVGARRRSETTRIMLERGPDVSFANCGLLIPLPGLKSAGVQTVDVRAAAPPPAVSRSQER